MRQFSQPVSMPCTQQQYEADLKKPLKEMGYKADNPGYRNEDDLVDDTITTGRSNVTAIVGKDQGCHYIPTYNPKLFLAIAAMCSDDPTKVLPGRYFKCLKTFTDSIDITYVQGKLICFDEHWTSVAPSIWVPATLGDLVEAFGYKEEGELKPLVFTIKEIEEQQEIMSKSWDKVKAKIAAPLSHKEALYRMVDLAAEMVDVLHRSLDKPETYDGALHKINMATWMGDGKISFDVASVEPIEGEMTQEFGTRVHEAAEAMLPKKVDNPLPGKNYLFHLVHDEFMEGNYIGKAENQQYVVDVNGIFHKVDTLYKMPNAKEYTEEDMCKAWQDGYILAVAGGDASQQSFQKYIQENHGKKDS